MKNPQAPHHVPASKGATSAASPLRIADVVTADGGRIGMTICPGKIGPGTHQDWARHLCTDLDAIRTWGASRVITLMEAHELEAYGVSGIGAAVQERCGADHWHHLPIRDVSVPDGLFEDAWRNTADTLHATLTNGGALLVHCLGGLGRTGVVACRLLVETGVPPDVALRRVREVRPGAVETPAQEGYVQTLLDHEDVIDRLNANPQLVRRLESFLEGRTA